MLYEIMKHIKNFFPVEGGEHDGVFTISEGTINLPFMLDGQYFMIMGSKLNDGVYKYPAIELENETFEGTVMEMAVPKDFIRLAEDIENWCTDNAKALDSVYTSESFGGYSRSKASGADGKAVTWNSHFANRLNAWRKL